MAKTFNFTQANIRKLPTPYKGRECYKDEKEKGLSLYITSTGNVTFFIRKRVNGKDERIVLGNYPQLNVDSARKAALQAKAIVAEGKHPNEKKNRQRQDITFGNMYHEFMERYSKRFKKTWKDDEREINKFLSHWFPKKALQITKQDVQKEHEKVLVNNGLYQANRVLERIIAIYNKHIEWGWTGSNPAFGVKKFKEKSRERFMQSDEIPRFFKALAEEENVTARDFFIISLLTGARKGNVLAMRWEEINFNARIWHIPETKNGEPLTVPLAEQAIDALKNRLDLGIDSEFVFPGSGKTGHLADPKKAWKRILDRAGIKNLRIHDLRRTMGSWQAATGATTAIIGKSLGHKSHQATKVYERLNIDPVRESMTRAADAMFSFQEK